MTVVISRNKIWKYFKEEFYSSLWQIGPGNKRLETDTAIPLIESWNCGNIKGENGEVGTNEYWSMHLVLSSAELTPGAKPDFPFRRILLQSWTKKTLNKNIKAKPSRSLKSVYNNLRSLNALKLYQNLDCGHFSGIGTIYRCHRDIYIFKEKQKVGITDSVKIMN